MTFPKSLNALLLMYALLPLAACALVASCAPGTERAAVPQGGPSTAVASRPVPPEYAGMVAYVNEVRAAGYDCGATGRFGAAPPLAWNPKLAEAARDHNQDMLSHTFFGHAGSDGRTAGYRVERRGYDWLEVGENLAYAAPGHFTVTSVVEAWLGSPGHCAVLMSAAFKEMGAARAGGAWEVWTQVFATPR